MGAERPCGSLALPKLYYCVVGNCKTSRCWITGQQFVIVDVKKPLRRSSRQRQRRYCAVHPLAEAFNNGVATMGRCLQQLLKTMPVGMHFTPRQRIINSHAHKTKPHHVALRIVYHTFLHKLRIRRDLFPSSRFLHSFSVHAVHPAEPRKIGVMLPLGHTVWGIGEEQVSSFGERRIVRAVEPTSLSFSIRKRCSVASHGVIHLCRAVVHMNQSSTGGRGSEALHRQARANVSIIRRFSADRPLRAAPPR